MKTSPTSRPQLRSSISSGAFWAVAVLIAGLIGGLWFELADRSAWEAVALVAVLGLTAVPGITWQQLHARARARRRWHAALAAYAEREIRQLRRRTARRPRHVG
jgi:hypothetical protein